MIESELLLTQLFYSIAEVKTQSIIFSSFFFYLSGEIYENVASDFFKDPKIQQVLKNLGPCKIVSNI